jgi:hypothetical protein
VQYKRQIAKMHLARSANRHREGKSCLPVTRLSGHDGVTKKVGADW